MPNLLEDLVNNPVTRAIGHAAGSIWNMTSLAQRLKDTAAYQHQLQQKQAQQQYQDEMGMRKIDGTPIDQGDQHLNFGNSVATKKGSPKKFGGVPVVPMTPMKRNAGGPEDVGASELQTDVDSPSHVQRTPWGIPWHIPDQMEAATNKRKETPEEPGFTPAGGLAEALGKIGIPIDQKIRYKDLGEAMKAAGWVAPEAQEAQDIDTKSFSTPVRIGKKTGKVAPLELPEGVTPAEKPDKPDSMIQLQDRVGPKGGPLFYDKNTKSVVEAPVPEGSKREMTAAQTAAEIARQESAARLADSREETNRRRSLDDNDRQLKLQQFMQDKHNKSFDEEHKQWDLKQSYIEAAGSNEDQVVDPRTGREVANTPELKRAYTALAKDAENRALQKQKESAQIRKQMQWGEFGPDPGEQGAQSAPPAGAAPPVASPAQPKPGAHPAAAAPAAAPAAKPLASWDRLAKPGQGKLTDPNKAKQYLQKAGGDKAKARGLAKADGWEF